ncbi:MAG: hypothetical protein ACRBB5_08800 [Nitrosopumilus sp.]
MVDGLQKQTNVPLSIKEITSLSFNIRCPGEITVYHDDKVSKIDRDGTVSGKKSKLRRIIGFQEHTLALWIWRNLNKNGLQNPENMANRVSWGKDQIV